MNSLDARYFRSRLLGWYRRNRRDLPWRRRPTLYPTLVAEFMLQQTRVEQALPYYRRFMRKFPSLRALAHSPSADVLKLWEGLGYYRRAQQLHDSARRLHRIRSPNPGDLDDLPGVGPYTRAAIGSIVFGQPWPVVDGNVKRVVSRLIGLRTSPDSAPGKRRIQQELDQLISRRAPASFNQAMMELGARVCTPRRPDCGRCPVRTGCRALATGRTSAIPVRKSRAPRPHHHIAAAVIRRQDGRFLIAQRLPDGLLPNLWEFPGGKQERGETLAQCCAREIREELGIGIRVGRRFSRVDHAYSHYSVTLHFFQCLHTSGRPKAIGCQAHRWVRARELGDYPFPRANWDVVELLRNRETGRRIWVSG